MRMRAMRWATAAVLSTALLGCDPEPADPPDDDALALALDLRAATHGVASLDGTPGFVRVGNLFAYSPSAGVDPTDLDAVRADAVSSVHSRLALTFAALGCESELDSDDDTTVSLSLQGCRLELLELDVEAEAVARVEPGPCGTDECPAEVVWALDIGVLKSGPIGLAKSGYEGPLELVAPLDPDARMRWTTTPGFVIETARGLRFDTISSADWAVDDDGCTDLELGARLTLQEREDALDERLGDLVVAARGLQRCPGQCAHAGEVQLSFGAGRVVAWTHDGSDTLIVEGPGGREVEVTPPCAEQQPAQE